jgi:sugar lactone lactonase YvrE
MQTLAAPEKVMDGLMLPEAPRWRDGALYFADFLGGRVYVMRDGDARPSVLQDFGGEHIGGIGWAPNGDLLTVLQRKLKVLRTHNGKTEQFADLATHAEWAVNDMIVNADGTAYISPFGLDMWGDGPKSPSKPVDLVLVQPDGGVGHAGAGEVLKVPNGMALSSDGKKLYVSEPGAALVSTYTIGAVGKLSGREVHSQTPGTVPDGICIDSEGAVWAGNPVAIPGGAAGPGCTRYVQGQGATHIAPSNGRMHLACVLGGADRKTLFICSVENHHAEHARKHKTGWLEKVRVDVAGAGRP